MTRATILITTYNLENYICKALDSILNQRTKHKFQIIVADDCSTDKTIEYLREYEKKHPDIIKFYPSNQNVGSLANSIKALELCHTEYFSFLDGDDYWISEHRLEKQINFLDANTEYSMCGGNTLFMRDSQFKNLLNTNGKLEYSFHDYINGTCPFVHTSSLLYRNTVFSSDIFNVFRQAIGTLMECAFRGEDARFALHMKYGKLKLFDEVFSVYRIHDRGIWQGASDLKRSIESTISAYAFGTLLFPEHQKIFFEKFLLNLKRVQNKFLNHLSGDLPLPTEDEIDLYCGLLKIAVSDEINANLGKPISVSIKRRIAEKIYTALGRQLYL